MSRFLGLEGFSGLSQARSHKERRRWNPQAQIRTANPWASSLRFGVGKAVAKRMNSLQMVAIALHLITANFPSNSIENDNELRGFQQFVETRGLPFLCSALGCHHGA